MSQPTQQPRTLARVMGQWDLIALTVNGVIGSAIYIMPGTIFELTGAFSPFTYLIGALVTLVFVLVFAEVSSRFDAAGGPYLYAYEAFGKFVGFEIGWIAYLTRLSSVAANYNLFIIYFGHFFPSAQSGVLRASVIFVLLAMFTIINIRGVKYGAWTVDAITIAKILPIILLMVVGISYVDTGNISVQEVPPAEGFMRAMFLLVFAYGGFEIVTIPSAESVNPKRHVPRALVASLAIIATFYCIVQVIAVGVLPTLASEERPIAAVAAIIMGNFGANLVAFGALISTFGYFSGSILGVPRLTFALAEKKQLPSYFAAVHPKFQTPYISIIFYSVLTFLLAVFSDFITLAAVSVVSRLLYYITTSSAVIAFRRTSKAPFTIPFGPAIPLIGILIALYLFQYPTEKEVYFTAGGIAVGTILYFFVRRGESK